MFPMASTAQGANKLSIAIGKNSGGCPNKYQSYDTLDTANALWLWVSRYERPLKDFVSLGIKLEDLGLYIHLETLICLSLITKYLRCDVTICEKGPKVLLLTRAKYLHDLLAIHK